MTTKTDQIRQLYDGVRTTREIADIVGCLPAYVRVVARQKRASDAPYKKRRYHSDPDFRAKHIARTVARAKYRYRNDPEFRARKIAIGKARYRRLKQAEVRA